MSKTSKTARASAVVMAREKVVIPDETYVKDLRNNLDSGLHVTQESARALLRKYDALIDHSVKIEEQLTNLAGEKQAALDLLNEHLTGRKAEGGYKDLDDALRQLLQAFVINRDLAREQAAELEMIKTGELACGCDDPNIPSGAHFEGCALYKKEGDFNG